MAPRISSWTPPSIHTGAHRYPWMRGGTLLLLLALCACSATAGSSAPTASRESSTSIDLLPTLGPTPSVRAAKCGGRGGPRSMGQWRTYSSIEAQAWAAEHIVLGRVEARETRWEILGGTPTVASYVRIRVEDRVRGVRSETLLVGDSNGTIDGCTQPTNLQPFQLDGRYILFLRRSIRPEFPNEPPVYGLDGGEASRIAITDPGAAATTLAAARLALAKSPPPDLDPSIVVPLDRAPVMPTATSNR